MKLKFCSCRMCRLGRHSKYSKAMIKRAVRHGRRLTKYLIKAGKYDEIPESISVPYTD